MASEAARRDHSVRASEYGGSDTHKTMGIQPSPHTLLPYEQLRVLYSGTPEVPIPQPTSTIETLLPE